MKKKYKALDMFMIRTPIYPLEKYKGYFLNTDDNNVNYKEVEDRKEIDEAICVASKSLYNSMLDDNYGDIDKVNEAFDKYYNRMTTRCTPYGLFAGINVGRFGSGTSINLKDLNQHKKFIYPDVEWILNLIKLLEEDKDILMNIEVIKNSCIYQKGNRIENVFFTQSGVKNEELSGSYEKVSIRYTKVVDYIFELSDKGILVKDIIKILKDQLTQIPEEVIINLVVDLVKKEYLITEFKTTNITNNSLWEVIKILEKADTDKKYLDKLYEIEELFLKYIKTSIGNGIKTYSLLLDKMKGLSESSNYIQIDLKTEFEKCVINRRIKEDIEGFSDVLAAFSSLNINNENWTNYKSEFVEKYGTNRRVPLLEVVDEDMGLGFPAGYINSDKSAEFVNSNQKVELFKEILIEKVISAIKENKNEIEIEENDLYKLKIFDLDYKEDLPISFDLYFIINAKSSDSIDSGDYKLFLASNMGSASAGRIFGRFCSTYDDEVLEELSKINELEKQVLDEKTIIAELVSIPKNGRFLNITRTFNIREAKIPLGMWAKKENCNIIEISDLSIGIYNNEFILWSEKYNSKVIINKNHMLNKNICANLYRFLLEVSNRESIFNLGYILDKTFERFLYHPRIRYKNIILKNETWILNNNILEVNKNDTLEKFKENILLWKDNNSIPDNLCLAEYDNRLIINFKNTNHIKYLFKLLRSKRQLVFTELEFNLDNTYVKDRNNYSYVAEVVVPVVRGEKNKVINVDSKLQIIQSGINKVDREFLPISKWIYLNLYGNKNRENELLTEYIYKFIKDLEQKDYIEKAFFIRYSVNSKKHIRLRLLKKYEEKYEIYKELESFLQNIKIDGLLSTATMDTYEREAERYGGIEIYDEVEDYFYHDSMMVLELLKQIHNGVIKLDKKIIAAISIIRFMEDFGFKFVDQLTLFDMVVDVKEHRAEFAKYRRQLIEACNSNDNWNGLSKTDEGLLLLDILSCRTESIKRLKLKIFEQQENNKLTNNINNILLSLFHMYCNRFFGIDRFVEREVYAYIRHTLYALKFFKK